jgi:hypothetical protein
LDFSGLVNTFFDSLRNDYIRTEMMIVHVVTHRCGCRRLIILLLGR